MTKATPTTFHWSWLTRFRGSVHYPHGRKPGSVQAGLALEELRILHLVSKGKQEKTGSGAARRRVSKPTPTVTHFLIVWAKYSNT